jgi:hypothetical protein
MQKDFENGKCAHRKEKIPVGAIFGLVFLEFYLMSSLTPFFLGQLTG